MEELPKALDPAVWRPEDLARSEAWRHAFTGRELAELLAVARETAGAEEPPASSSLPVLAPGIEKTAHELKSGMGFRILRGLPVKGLGKDGAAAAFMALSRQLGSPMEQPGGAKRRYGRTSPMRPRGVRSSSSHPGCPRCAMRTGSSVWTRAGLWSRGRRRSWPGAAGICQTGVQGNRRHQEPIALPAEDSGSLADQSPLKAQDGWASPPRRGSQASPCPAQVSSGVAEWIDRGGWTEAPRGHPAADSALRLSGRDAGMGLHRRSGVVHGGPWTHRSPGAGQDHPLLRARKDQAGRGGGRECGPQG